MISTFYRSIDDPIGWTVNVTPSSARDHLAAAEELWISVLPMLWGHGDVTATIDGCTWEDIIKC